jgi:hypothetical protein
MDRNYPMRWPTTVDRKCGTIIDECYDVGATLLNDKREKMDEIAKVMLERCHRARGVPVVMFGAKVPANRTPAENPPAEPPPTHARQLRDEPDAPARRCSAPGWSRAWRRKPPCSSAKARKSGARRATRRGAVFVTHGSFPGRKRARKGGSRGRREGSDEVSR